MVETASKLSFFYRDPERPFDTEREELGLVWSRTQWVKAVAKGWFQMLFGRLVSGGKC